MTNRPALERFFHDLATPLSGLSLHLERAHRLGQKGQDTSEALAIARQELEKALALFEKGRGLLLTQGEGEITS